MAAADVKVETPLQVETPIPERRLHAPAPPEYEQQARALDVDRLWRREPEPEPELVEESPIYARYEHDHPENEQL